MKKQTVKKSAKKVTAKAPIAMVSKKASKKSTSKKTESKIQYFGLVSLSKKVGWLHFAFKEAITAAELEAFNEHNLARRLKATAVVISKDIYDYWVSEEIHNVLEMTDLSSEPFGFLPGKDDGIYEEILELNPGYKIK
ncbi:hypothetical protein CNR22_21170 [Sphingobacteriaceae bacterium]|nr:hypothetical protein CNR22_21170 [Sphingobacteriaceae bacterium]